VEDVGGDGRGVVVAGIHAHHRLVVLAGEHGLVVLVGYEALAGEEGERRQVPRVRRRRRVCELLALEIGELLVRRIRLDDDDQVVALEFLGRPLYGERHRAGEVDRERGRAGGEAADVQPAGAHGFDFGGIVPGYAAQKVIDLLRSKNINIALADASGDIVMSNEPQGKNGWSIGITLPESENELWDKKLELKNCAVSTSGDVYRYTMHEGKKYSHIIDPRSGYGMTTQRNVTVITKFGTDADWLATACSILPIKKALKLAKKEHGVILIATLSGEKIVTYKSENFDKSFQKKQP